MVQLVLQRSDIEKLIPHRGDMLLLDNVISYSKDKLVCSKYLNKCDKVFSGHFPEDPIYPGVYLVEAMAQAGAIKVSLDAGEGKKEGRYYMLKIDNAKFRAPAVPGDKVTYEVTVKDLEGYYMIKGIAMVSNRIIASASITTMVK